MTAVAASLSAEVIRHHLRLFGLAQAHDASQLVLYTSPDGDCVPDVDRALSQGRLVVCVCPEVEFCRAFGVEVSSSSAKPPVVLDFDAAKDRPWRRLRTLHRVYVYRASGESIVQATDGGVVWLYLPRGDRGILFVGTDVAGDLVRYRQGDPGRAGERPTETLWGIPGERPNYLFESQLEGEAPHERHADWWAMALAQEIATRLGVPLDPILPGNAPGAVVLTGDDDQAYLEKYAEQRALIGSTPITYFLHPLTRHTGRTLRRLGRQVDLGLHPDALDKPEQYAALFEEQAAWFRNLTGGSALSVRNHGFLNDGYWGHLRAWTRAGVRISANLPGADGRVLNGSLLPARVAFDGQLTGHWSILTAIGDGVRFALGMSDSEAGDCVRSFAARVQSAALPGVIVLNLHPQNVGETRGMHDAALDLIKRGFLAWSLRDCLAWFDRRDRCEAPARSQAWLARLFCKARISFA